MKEKALELWFDVGKDRYTALAVSGMIIKGLWFDVGKDRYTAYDRLV